MECLGQYVCGRDVFKAVAYVSAFPQTLSPTPNFFARDSTWKTLRPALNSIVAGQFTLHDLS
jgi:hypothetical protein